MSYPPITPANLHDLNQSFAGNLATTPATPKRPAANSAKKRRQMPDLSRPTATPGHGVKMSMIFHDAANSLRGSRLPIYQPSSNTKRARLPLSQGGSIKFGSTCQDDDTMSVALASPSKISQYLGKSCQPDWAPSEVIHHPASGFVQHYPTSTPVTKAGSATSGTLTKQRLGAATPKIGKDSPPSQIEEEGTEPTSYGLTTPAAPTLNSVENLEEVRYPILESWRSQRTSSKASILGSYSDDPHSTHGVPSIMPFPQLGAAEEPRSDIHSWLNEVLEATTLGLLQPSKQCHDTEDLLMNDAPISRSTAPNVSSPIRPQELLPKLRKRLQSPSGASSNKENISPSNCSSSPTRLPVQYLQRKTSFRLCQTNTQPSLPHTDALHFSRPLTPDRPLSLPPKRKIARVKENSTSRQKTEMSTVRSDFTVHEDHLAEALAHLSPHVERHRKGRGPKRERCMSYWDEDIVQPASSGLPMEVDDDDHRGETIGNGKQILCESQKTDKLATERPFVKEAEFASFEFEAWSSLGHTTRNRILE